MENVKSGLGLLPKWMEPHYTLLHEDEGDESPVTNKIKKLN